jgi:hypothetical protein
MQESTQIRVAGSLCLLAGALIWGIAFGVVPAEPGSVHAPVWILSLAGGVFALAGLALVFRSHEIFVCVLGNLIILCFAGIGAWVSLFGPAAHFSGGVPFVSPEANVTIARVAFGCGALLCALILIPGLHQLQRLIRAR